MKPKKIGLLFGMETSFPEALEKRINELGAGRVVCEPVKLDAVRQDLPLPYDLILDRISQDVPFYRTVLKYAAIRGTDVVNNPFWWTAEDKLSANAIAAAVGVAVPKTFLLPHNSHPPGTRGESFRNLVFPIGWDRVFEFLGFPIFLKPALGGGWKNVTKVNDAEEFFAAYNKSGDLTMLAQEAIAFDAYYRCYCIGRDRIRIMRYDPAKPYLQNYVADVPPLTAELRARIERDCKAICNALGHDFNTLEFAIRKGVPVAIDFTNPAPDADVNSVGKESFAWVVENAAQFLLERVLHPRALELGGSWPAMMGLAKPATSVERPAVAASTPPKTQAAAASASASAPSAPIPSAPAAPPARPAGKSNGKRAKR